MARLAPSLLLLPLAAAALAVPGVALARDVLVPPLLDTGSPADLRATVHGALAQELDFANEVDRVVAPGPVRAMSRECYQSPACLAVLGEKVEVDTVVVGAFAAAGQGARLELQLVDVGSKSVTRRVNADLPASADGIADGLGPLVVLLMTGERADEDERRLEDRPRDDALSEEELAAIPDPPPGSEGPALDLDTMALGEQDVSDVVPGDRGVSGDTAEAAPDDDPDDDAPAAPGSGDTAGTADTAKAATSSAANLPVADDEAPLVQLTVRGGYARFQTLGFATYGGEISVRLPGLPLRILAGVAGWSAYRVVPEVLREPDGPEAIWDTLVPIKLGAAWSFPVNDLVHPYVGLEGVAALLYNDADTGVASWTLGGRARGGLDLGFTPNVGLNLDLAVGVWASDAWQQIEPDLLGTSVLLEGSAGVYVAF